MDCGTRPHAGAVRLRLALERLAGALATLNLDTILACETELASALSDLSDPGGTPAPDRAATSRELVAARAALMRSRRLGSTIGDLTRLSQAARGDAPSYGRLGQSYANMAMRSLEAKV